MRQSVCDLTHRQSFEGLRQDQRRPIVEKVRTDGRRNLPYTSTGCHKPHSCEVRESGTVTPEHTTTVTEAMNPVPLMRILTGTHYSPQIAATEKFEPLVMIANLLGPLYDRPSKPSLPGSRFRERNGLAYQHPSEALVP
jgi:hypothetical protein